MPSPEIRTLARRTFLVGAAAGLLGLAAAPGAAAAKTGQDISNPHVFTVRTVRSCTGGGDADLAW